jgi:para-nitrobenzyl esterase
MLFLLLAPFIVACGRPAGQSSGTAETTIDTGSIEGLSDAKTSLEIYLGIPFAKPPVGELRWRAPQAAEKWQGVRAAKKFGPRPVQARIWDDMRFRSEEMSEDCLYLNVWTPARKGQHLLPVLVYFYGGGYIAGDGSETRYDGAAMAQQGIVVLTVNYRLNLFGFFAHPELSAEAPCKASGNYGLLDQNAALQWVQRNIEAFGGDPARVTIAGESAGSISVSAQMASPLSKGLIAGAIGESGAAIHPTREPVPLAEAEQRGVEFARKTGCTSLAELRALPTSRIFEIYTQSGGKPFPVVLDGYFFPRLLPEIFTQGEQAQVPLLAGWNSAEISGQGFTRGPYTEQIYHDRLKEAFPEDWEEAARLYPHGSEREIELSATALASDRFIAYSTWKWIDLHLRHSAQPVYRYLYSKLRPPLANRPCSPDQDAAAGSEAKPATAAPIGAPHACEIEYAMGNLPLITDFAWTAEDYAVSRTMLSYFANFIKRGDPNGEGLPEWPAMRTDDPAPLVMVIDVESGAAAAQQEARYRFLDRFYGKR